MDKILTLCLVLSLFLSFSGCMDNLDDYYSDTTNDNSYDTTSYDTTNDNSYDTTSYDTTNDNSYDTTSYDTNSYDTTNDNSYDIEYYKRHYTWKYKGKTWTWDISIPKKLYEYYKNKPHNREENYAQYALSDYDRPYLDSMINGFKKTAEEEGFSDYDTVMFIVSFVQSLKYTSDKVTTGYDEYPRYPIETLVDNGGDCEDTAILTAALLHELGYGVVLIELPEHMAVGVKGGGGIYGSYYDYNGGKYYYLETTNTGWDIGQIPPEYENTKVTIRPMVQIPKMELTFTSNLVDYDEYYVYYKVYCKIKNLGPGTAKNPKLYICALALDKGENYIWKPEHTIDLEDYPEGASGSAYAILKIPRGAYTQIKCILYGDNFKSVEVYSEKVTI